MIPNRTIPIAKLSDVQAVTLDDNPFPLGDLVTAAQAAELLKRATKVLAVVAITPRRGHYFEIEPREALKRMKALPPDTRVICDLQSDGWCWIGTEP